MVDAQVTEVTLPRLELGQSAERVRLVASADLEAFAAVSGDTNPLHLDEAYAATTAFKGRVAHGMLLGAWISALIGTELPGPGAIYVSQTLTFKRAVRIGDEVITRVEVTQLDEAAGHAVLATCCLVRGKAMAQGEAVVRLPKPPRAAAPRPGPEFA
jgi:3-hydroxybutyryl-CoA dehydratase